MCTKGHRFNNDGGLTLCVVEGLFYIRLLSTTTTEIRDTMDSRSSFLC